MDTIILSRKADRFVPKNRWIASLSNGETIFEDNRKNVPAAWERLSKYVEREGLKITKLRVQLGPLEVSLPPNKDGYVQKKKVESDGSITKKHWCIGHIEDNLALIHYISDNRSSYSKIENDPGHPFTIYNRS